MTSEKVEDVLKHVNGELKVLSQNLNMHSGSDINMLVKQPVLTGAFS